MLAWSITFFMIAMVAALLGFGGLAGAAAGIAKFLAILFLVMFIGSLIFGLVTGKDASLPPVR